MSRTRHSNKDHFKLELKRFGYLLFLLPASLPVASYLLWLNLSGTGWQASADLFAWLPLMIVYGIIPVADAALGKDRLNPQDHRVKALSQQRYYRWLLLFTLPVAASSLLLGLVLFTQWGALSAIGKLGVVLSFGTVHAGIMINAGHELIHKASRHEQRAGGILLSMVCYPSFKIEHVRGHHVHVATELDNSTARKGESLYAFLFRAFTSTVKTAWTLESALLRKRHRRVLSWHNELVRWYALVAVIALGSLLVFGFAGLAFFIAQSLVAVALLETVNYLEHYGLSRRRLENGRYERTTHHHSWNSNHLLSNMLNLQLQRHSDHHANPQRPYQVLRHFDDSPQLPAGYATMVMLAMVPPLWMRVMNPRVERYYAANERSAPLPAQ